MPPSRSCDCGECKKCKHRDYMAKWYARNRDRHIATVSRSRSRIRRETKELLRAYKAERGCHFCPECDPVCLDFHHLDSEEKEVDLGVVVSKGWSWERIVREIRKCIVVCANCHRKIHAGVLVVDREALRELDFEPAQ